MAGLRQSMVHVVGFQDWIHLFCVIHSVGYTTEGFCLLVCPVQGASTVRNSHNIEDSRFEGLFASLHARMGL